MRQTREFLEDVAPWTALAATVVNVTAFWVCLPFAFLVGACWAGIEAGFKMGRNW